jgi:predicted nucleic-acid-binding protein
MEIVDANIILRYMLDDHPELSERAREIIDNNIVDIPIEVLCEVVFVLSSVYKINRNCISEKLLQFINDTLCIIPHKEAIMKGIEFYGIKNLDFVDCILAGYHFIEESNVHTFDYKLKRFLEQ